MERRSGTSTEKRQKEEDKRLEWSDANDILLSNIHCFIGRGK